MNEYVYIYRSNHKEFVRSVYYMSGMLTKAEFTSDLSNALRFLTRPDANDIMQDCKTLFPSDEFCLMDDTLPF